MNKTRLLRVAAILFAFISINYAIYCEFDQPGGQVHKEPQGQVCPASRPEVCTMEYLPVCAELFDGSVETYSNACTACADKDVNAYREGACEEE
jgi:hypothetical protein